MDTDKKFTGQRLDSTGLYYYGARYYDPTIGRFISADTIVPNPADPQSFNRYSYCLNNPLRYIDPTGHNPGAAAAVLIFVPGVGWIFVLGGVVGVGYGLHLIGELLTGRYGDGFSPLEQAALQWDEQQYYLAHVGQGPYPTYHPGSIDDIVERYQQNNSQEGAGAGNDISTPMNPMPPNGQNKRDWLLSQAENPKLRDAVDQLYRPGATVGDGGTADIIRIQMDQGHIIKGIERYRSLEKILLNENLSANDRAIAESLYKDLQDALLQAGVQP